MYAKFKELSTEEKREYCQSPYAAHFLVSSGCNEHTINEIVSYGADIHNTNPEGQSPLCLAIKYQNLGAVKGLLSHGDYKSSRKYAECPVQRAVMCLCKLGRRKIRPSKIAFDILNELVNHGLRYENDNDLLRMDVFSKVGSQEAISLIFDAGFLHPVKPVIYYAYGSQDIVRINYILELLRRGYMPKKGFYSKKCIHALYRAVVSKNVKNIKKLLDAGFRAWVYRNDNTGVLYDPLWNAVFMTNHLADILLAYGADISQRTVEYAAHKRNTYDLISLLAFLRGEGEDKSRVMVHLDYFLHYSNLKLCILSNIVNCNVNFECEFGYDDLWMLAQDKSYPTLFDLISHDMKLQERYAYIISLKSKVT